MPDALHRKLKARAALAGQSLSDYLLGEIGRVAARPTRERDVDAYPRPRSREVEDSGSCDHSRGSRVGVIVVDASALVEFLLQTPLGLRVEARLFRQAEDFHAPHLIDVEVAQALRRLVRAGELRAVRAAQAIADLTDLDLQRHSHVDVLGRTWELRNNLTSYDAVYVALAEAIASPLVTCDGPLGTAPGHTVRVDVIRRALAADRAREGGRLIATSRLIVLLTVRRAGGPHPGLRRFPAGVVLNSPW